MWNEATISAIKRAEGSIQDVAGIPDDVKAVYRTAWELPMRSLIDMAAERGAYIDQSQSLNLFMESPTIGKLSSMYLHAWKQGLKTTYYLRSRPATRINKATAGHHADERPTPPGGGGEPAPVASYTDVEAVACSLENPESCEACQ
jgi:ribonucleoside-diphosphate reductase alpha chain